MRAVMLVAVLVAGCGVAAETPEVGVQGIPMAPTAELRAWHDGAAVAALEQAVALWRAAGADVLVNDWGYPVALVDGGGDWPHDQIGYGSPTGGIQINVSLLEEVAGQADGAAWLVDTFAHELGHVIGCGHVSDGTAVMYQNMHPSSSLAPSDVQEFARVHPALDRRQ
jgi:hypothetical protein